MERVDSRVESGWLDGDHEKKFIKRAAAAAAVSERIFI
jgi:hypothetical protein